MPIHCQCRFFNEIKCGQTQNLQLIFMTKMSRALYRSEFSGAQRKKQGRLKQTFILIITVLIFCWSWDSTFSTVTTLQVANKGLVAQYKAGTEIFHFSTLFRPDWRPMQPPIQWLTGASLPGDKAVRMRPLTSISCQGIFQILDFQSGENLECGLLGHDTIQSGRWLSMS